MDSWSVCYAGGSKTIAKHEILFPLVTVVSVAICKVSDRFKTRYGLRSASIGRPGIFAGVRTTFAAFPTALPAFAGIVIVARG